MKEADAESTISDELTALFTSQESVSSLLAADPTLAPGDAWKKLYGHHAGRQAGHRPPHEAGKAAPSKEELERAAKCGNWGPTEPGELFLAMYHDAVCAVEEDIGRAVVSPPLMGSCGVLPLTIISTIPDIARHMSNLIVRAEREVFLATNYWQNGVASRFISEAIRELSRRAGQRGVKAVVKVIYDRGSPKQLLEPHYPVAEKDYAGKAVALPRPDEIPNVDLEVMNYHQPMLGTFHSKYMVVDRKIAVLQSNNIQDNDNLEMMVHLEGPIVDSLYDVALISWHKRLHPPLPSHNSPAAQGGLGSFDGANHDAIFDENGAIKGHSAVLDPRKMRERPAYDQGDAGIQHPGVVDGGEQQQTYDAYRADTLTGQTTTVSVLHPHTGGSGDGTPSAAASAVASGTGHESHESRPSSASESTTAYLQRGEQPLPQAQIRDPYGGGTSLPEHNADDHHWDADIAGEVARVQASVSGKPGGETRLQAVNRHLNHTTNAGFPADAPECPDEEEMTPYVPHAAHAAFPMALVNRPPHGPPNHRSVANPQNAAWLAGLRNARKNVFIQSPTLNAEPLVPAIVEACERGVDVYCYICLGYNDAGELLPMQGGHNEMVAARLYAALSSPAARARLHYHWYVAKDQRAPIPQARKRRSCHIKLMIVDERVGVVGNGNQDTQSWYHSQEVNVMLDSPGVCAAWADALRRNQNTHARGALRPEDGVWRDAEGREAEGATGVDPGRFSWAKGVVGAVKRVQGVGGF